MKKSLQRWLVSFVRVYFTILFGWVIGYWLYGDQNGYLSLVHPFAAWLFTPLPAIWLFWYWKRGAGIFLPAAAASLLFVSFWGSLFLPNFSPFPAGGKHLTVMTYNLRGSNKQFEDVAQVLTREDADVVLLQELNLDMADHLEETFRGAYPFHILAAEEGVTGLGVFSKYPLTPRKRALPLSWAGSPQVFDLDLGGENVAMVNFHTWAPGLGPRQVVEPGFRHREAQARLLVKFAQRENNPVILAGDANTAPLSEAYKILAAELQDSWLEAGFGMGYTFPGGNDLRSRVTKIDYMQAFGFPEWFIRIDYIFVSKEWKVVKSFLAEPDGYSDHRPLISVIVLGEE